MQGYRDEFAAHCCESGVIVEWLEDGPRLTTPDGEAVCVVGIDAAAEIVRRMIDRNRTKRRWFASRIEAWAAFVRSMV